MEMAIASAAEGSALERHLRIHGMEQCISFFPSDMPLKAFQQMSDDVLKEKYGIKSSSTRSSLLCLVRHRCSSNSTDCRLPVMASKALAVSPSSGASRSSSPPQHVFSSSGGGASANSVAIARPHSPIKRGRLSNAEDSPPSLCASSALSRRLLQRTVSEDVRHRKKRPLSVSLSHSQHLMQHTTLGLAGHYLSASCASSLSGCTNDTTNLVRLRNSVLGHSAPNLSSSTRELSHSRKGSAGGRITPVKKTAGITSSQRCLSPQALLSPTDSPKTQSPFHQSLFSFSTGAKKHDHRRWSLVSLASSSGYGPSPNGTDCSDSLTSSHERLHHTSSGPPAIDCLATSPPSATCASGGIPTHLLTRKESCGCEESGCPLAESKESNENMSITLQRPRSRSLSSPMKLSETFMLNSLYRERFPKAVQQMEENLQLFIEENGGGIVGDEDDDPTTIGTTAADPGDSVVDSDGTLRFACRQVVALARDCLEQSRAQLLSTSYFQGLDENLDKLVHAAKAGSLCSADIVRRLTRRLQLITCRTARLLECLEFDPDEFYCLLEQAEGEAKKKICAADIPQYVISKLGLTKGPEVTSEAELLLSSASEGEKSDHDDQVDIKQHFRARPPTEDDFINIKLISNGAYGAVHLVKHKETRQRFAMKQILKSNLVLRNQVEQVFTERDILAFVDNPFVVSLYCTFETRTHLCLVLEYVEGGDCAALLKNMGPLPVDMARLYFAETVLALEYLHSYGIVHRDLKPDNLLITTFGHIKLTDFGLSKMGIMNLATNLYEGMLDKESKQFNDRQIFGTPEYIAPEVILRQGYGKPVDWWSMGIILYEFLVGCVPFFGDTPEELFSHVLTEGIEWPEEKEFCPPTDAQDLIFALLQRDPLERLGTGGAQEVKEHAFFEDLDWNGLLRQKAEFVPTLEGEDDTSYFDSRADRYHHEVEDFSNDDEDDPLFHSFTSCSPRYSRVYELFEENKERLREDGSSRRNSSVLSTPSSLERHCSGGSGSDLSESASSSPRSLPVSGCAASSGMLQSQGFHAVEPCSSLKLLDNMPVLDARPKPADARGAIAILLGGVPPALSVSEPAVMGLERVARMANNDTAKADSPCSCEATAHTSSLVTTPENLLSKLLACSLDSCVAAGPDRAGILMPYQEPAANQHIASAHGDVGHSINAANIVVAGSSGAAGISERHVSQPLNADVTLQLPDEGTNSLIPRDSLMANDHDTGQDQPLPAVPVSLPVALPYVSSKTDGLSEVTSRPERGLAARQLSLLIPPNEDFVGPPPLTSPVSSLGSRESSPTRDYIFSSLAKIPIVIKRGPRGYGFTLRAIRVFLGDGEKNLYTMHHLIVGVDKNGPAWEAGLRPGYIITHVNNEPVEGLNHTQVVAHILSKSTKVLVRALPIEETSIKTMSCTRGVCATSGSAAVKARPIRKSATAGLNAREKGAAATPRRQRHRSSSSLFKKLSKRNAEQSMVQTSWSASHLTVTGRTSPPLSSHAAATRLPSSPRLVPPGLVAHTLVAVAPDSSGSCSPASTGSTSPAIVAVAPASALLSSASAGCRPSTLNDPKGKLQSLKSPSRRKSIHNIPLSPLARTPSSSPMALSPTSATHSLSPAAISAGNSVSISSSSNTGNTGRTSAVPYSHHVLRHTSPSQVTRPSAVPLKQRSLAEPHIGSGPPERQPSPEVLSRGSFQVSAADSRSCSVPDEGESHDKDKQRLKRASRWQEKKNLCDSF